MIDNNSYKKTNNRLIISILAPSVILTIQFAIITIFKLSEGSSQLNLIGMISKLAMLVFLLPEVIHVIKINLKFAIIVSLVTILIILLNLLMFKQNIIYIQSNLLNILVSIVFFIYANAIDINCLDVVYKKMSKVANVILFISILMCLTIIIKDISVEMYAMSFGYYLLLPTLINIYHFSKSAKLIYLIKFLISIAMIVMIGSRGPIMCILIYVVLYRIINFKSLTVKQLIIYIILILTFIIIILNAQTLINVLLDICNKLGINSRTLTFLSNNKITYGSGRNELYNEAFNFIYNNPIIGGGLLVDRVVLDGTYVHNIFLEIIMVFGIPLGVIIILVMITFICISIFNKNEKYRNLILIWFCVGFVPLLISGSIIGFYQVWIFFGLVLSKSKLKCIN